MSMRCYVRRRQSHIVPQEREGRHELTACHLLEPRPDSFWTELFLAHVAGSPDVRLDGDKVYFQTTDRAFAGALAGLDRRIDEVNAEYTRRYTAPVEPRS